MRLRRQIRRNYRKPLILMSPKSLLRHPAALSSVEELTEGAFHCAIDDPAFVAGDLDRSQVRRVIVCSGKVYYTLLAAREDSNFNDVALVRLEQLHPFPFDLLRDLLAAYPAHDIVWCQEEPWNMGAWSYVQERMRRVLGPEVGLRYVGRVEAASPAAGLVLDSRAGGDGVRARGLCQEISKAQPLKTLAQHIGPRRHSRRARSTSFRTAGSRRNDRWLPWYQASWGSPPVRP